MVLESRGPRERAVFCLREVFGYEHAEIAESLGMTAVAVRQTAHRARSRGSDELGGIDRERQLAR